MIKALYSLVFTILAIPAFTSAQLGTDIMGGGGISIKSDPLYPSPESEFSVTLDDYSSPDRIIDIKWRIDGSYTSSNDNLRKIVLLSGTAGTETEIDALLTTATGRELVVSKNISPLYLDIIVEPQTRAPSFYLGRPLPSVGSTVNLSAVLSGYTGSQSDLIYNWRLNNKSVHGSGLKGKSFTSILTPMGSYFIITLEVSEQNGNVIAKRNMEVRSVSPSLLFYEINPLLGLSNIAKKDFNLIGDSVTTRAEPYHMSLHTYNDPSIMDWKISGQLVSPNDNPYEITLFRGNTTGSGRSNVSLHVRSLGQLLQGAESSFRVNY